MANANRFQKEHPVIGYNLYLKCAFIECIEKPNEKITWNWYLSRQ